MTLAEQALSLTGFRYVAEKSGEDGQYTVYRRTRAGEMVRVESKSWPDYELARKSAGRANRLLVDSAIAYREAKKREEEKPQLVLDETSIDDKLRVRSTEKGKKSAKRTAEARAQRETAQQNDVRTTCPVCKERIMAHGRLKPNWQRTVTHYDCMQK